MTIVSQDDFGLVIHVFSSSAEQCNIRIRIILISVQEKIAFISSSTVFQCHFDS